jgi:acetyltransferase
MCDTHEAEFGLLVSDAFQRRGVGTELLQRLVQVGRDEQLIVSSLKFCLRMLPCRGGEKVGFAIAHKKEIVRAAVDL